MTTVGDLIDRVYRDFLTPADDQPLIIRSADTYAADATLIEYSNDDLSPDEAAAIAPGVLLEHGSELMRVTRHDDEVWEIYVTRGVDGTTAGAISTDDEIVVAPIFPRKVVFDAVADNIAALYPDLCRIADTTVTAASGPVEVPAEVATILEAFYLSASGRKVDVPTELLEHYPPAATGRAVLLQAPTGKDVYLVYEARFARPTAEADTLADLGVDDYQALLCVGTAAHVVAGREFDSITNEYLTQQMEREGLPVGSISDVRDGLLRYQTWLLSKAKQRLRATREVPVVMHR